MSDHRYSLSTLAGILACTLQLGVGGTLLAQAAAPGLDPQKPISQYVHDSWTIDEGLPQNSVFAIAQGRDGYLWLGTESGVARFDGAAFTTYTSANTSGLSDNYITGLLVDRADTVWAATWIGGVTRLIRGKAIPAPADNRSTVNVLYQDRSGTIWVGQTGGLARWQDGQFRSVPGIRTTVYTIGEGADGTLLVGTENGIGAWRNGRVVPWQPAGGKVTGPVWAICLDRHAGLWIGTPDALYHAANGGLRRYTKDDGLPVGGVSAILETRNGQLWVGVDGGGIARMEGARLQAFTAEDGLTDDAVTSLLEDPEGSLWVGTRHGGLNRFREPLFTIYTTRQGLSANIVWSVYGDSHRNLWIGTGNGGLDRLHDGRVTRFEAKGTLPDESVFATLQTADGTLWVATGSGIARLRHGRWERLGSPFPTTRTSAFLEDRTGALWIGATAGLYRWKGGRLHDYSREAGLFEVKVRTIVEDREGTLWIGSHGYGLVRFKDGQFTSFTTEDGLSSDVVESLFADQHGLWVGTEKGINLLRDGRIAILPVSAAVATTDVFQILKDDIGNLWLSSNQGLASVNQRELLEAADGRRGSVLMHDMVSLDGRRRIEFNGGSQNAGWKSADGRLWFPSIKGLVVVDPARLASNPVPPEVHIERLLLDGRPVELGADLELPPGEGDLELHYTATSLLIPERVSFRYRLLGYDADWVEAGNRRVAYYTRVPGGRYRFQVVAANNDGVWNLTGAVLPFRLGLHFFETSWFYSLSGIVLLAAIWGIFRLRVRRIRQQAGDLAELVEERTGELQQEVVERRHAEERYRHLFDTNPQPVWVSDRDTLAFLAVNDSATRHYGYTREQFATMHLTDLQPPDQGQAFPDWIRAAANGGRGTSTWHQQRQDGTTLEVEVAAQAFTFAGRPAVLVVAADVTARQNLEERLRQSQKMEAVGQLAGGIAHDLNNVLTAVMAHVDLAVATLPPGDALLGDLTQAQRAAHRGAGMIRKLLGFSRRERLLLKPLRLEQLVGELVLTLRRVLPVSIDLVVSPARELPPVAADAGAVQQMLLNLATNARDAMPLGGQLTIDVGLATPTDELMAAQEWGSSGHYVVLAVSDNGCGMDAATQARIFEPYFTTKLPDEGTGLGMAMVYGLMKQHQGYVLVNSRPGGGTGVRLYFPITADAIPSVAPEIRQAAHGGDQTILVVEDQEAVRRATMSALTRFGFRVLAAADGVEGLQLWRDNADTIDLVISDAVMPRMGGMALFEAMSRERPGVRFLLTSGYTGEEVRRSAPLNVELPFLSKPWTINELLAAVREMLTLV